MLPRHWDWLNVQPGGASVALRKLVDEARRTSGHRDRVRAAQEAAYRFLSAVAGNLPGFEEATRALFHIRPAALHRTDCRLAGRRARLRRQAGVRRSGITRPNN